MSSVSANGRFAIHATTPDAWARDRLQGEYRPPSLAREGFVHASWPDQLPGTLARFFAGANEVIAVVLDVRALGDRLVCEDTSGHGEFPHVYGAISDAAIVAVHRLARQANGVFGAPRDWLVGSGP